MQTLSEKILNGLQHCLPETDEEGMSDCISCPYNNCCDDETEVNLPVQMVDDIRELLKEQETVEPKTGHWIYKKYDDMFICSCCEKYSIRNNYPYCHWCGAKMEGSERDA